MKRYWDVALGLGIVAMFFVACSVPQSYKTYAFVTSANGISAFLVNTYTGALTEVSRSPFTYGADPSPIAFDPSGKFAYVADNSSDSISFFTINAATGVLTATAGSPFQLGHEIESIRVHPSGNYVYAVNCYEAGAEFRATVAAYTINATTGAMNEIAGSPYVAGIWPHFIELDPSGKFAYVTGRDDDVVYAFEVNEATGALTRVAGSPFLGVGAVLVAHPSGKFVYLISSGSIKAYMIDVSTGALARSGIFPFEYVSTLAIDPSGRFAYVMSSVPIPSVLAKIDADTGALTAVASLPLPFDMNSWPRGIAIEPSGKFAYVRWANAANISAFAIDPATGVLTEVAGSPFAVSDQARTMVIIRIAQ